MSTCHYMMSNAIYSFSVQTKIRTFDVALKFWRRIMPTRDVRLSQGGWVCDIDQQFLNMFRVTLSNIQFYLFTGGSTNVTFTISIQLWMHTSPRCLPVIIVSASSFDELKTNNVAENLGGFDTPIVNQWKSGLMKYCTLCLLQMQMEIFRQM